MVQEFKIEDNVLLRCRTSAVKVTIPDGVERLEERAFKGCTLLETIEIPATVSKLDIDFSRDCDSLTSVKLSEGVKEICTSIFARCEKLTSLEYTGTMAQFNAIKGVAKVWVENTLPEITCSDGIIPRPVFIIDEGRLLGCDKNRIAADLEIPSGVIKVGKSAFEGIETLKSIKMCSGLKVIDFKAFSRCTFLETVGIAEGLDTIGVCAFAGCTALRSIALPATLKWIASSAFQGCNSLTTVHYAGTLEQWEKIQGKERLWIDIPASEVICSDGSASRSLLLIEDGVLKACTDKSITTVPIPEGINEIGEYAFQNCEKLEVVEIPRGVTKVSYCAFDACKALKSVTFPEGLKEIRAQAFQHCESLTAIEIPESVEKVYSGAFNWCKSLKSIKLPSNWEKIDTFIFETLPSDYEILCPEGSTTYKAAKKSSKLKTHLKAVPSVAAPNMEKEFKMEGGAESTVNSSATSKQESFSMSFYDNSIDGFCTLHIYTKTEDEYNKLRKVLLDNKDLLFDSVDEDYLINNIDNGPEVAFVEEMYGYKGDPKSAINCLSKLEDTCGFKFKYTEIFAGDYCSDNFIIEKGADSNYASRGQWYELYDDCEVSDYWAIIEYIEDGDVYLAERDTLNSVDIIITNKKTGEEIGSCPVLIETDATDDEVYEKLRDNDFYLTFLGIPIADSIEKLNAMEWRQDFYDYLQNDPSIFLSDLSNEDFDVDGLTVDDLSFTVK